MSVKELITVLVIYLFIPLAGLIVYLRLIKQAKRAEIKGIPTAELFIIFSVYGGLLLVLLTQIFWKWSGMASLGTVYLVIIAPIFLGVFAFINFKKRKLSKYHLWVFWSSILYFAIGPLLLGGLIFIVTTFNL